MTGTAMDGCSRHNSARVLLASESGARQRAVGSTTTKWWQLTGKHPLHPSGEPLNPL